MSAVIRPENVNVNTADLAIERPPAANPLAPDAGVLLVPDLGFGQVGVDLAEVVALLQRVAATIDQLSYDSEPQMWFQFGEAGHNIHRVLGALHDIADCLQDDFRQIANS